MCAPVCTHVCAYVHAHSHTHKINLLNFKQIKTFEHFIEKSASEIVTAESPGCCRMNSLSPCLIFSGEAMSLHGPSFIMCLDLLMHLLVSFSYPGKEKGGSTGSHVGNQGHPGYFKFLASLQEELVSLRRKG